MDDNKIVVKEGDVVTIYNVLFTLDDNETNKRYVLYTDNSLDDNGDLVIQASIQDPKTNELIAITDPKEQKIVETALQAVEETMKAKKES